MDAKDKEIASLKRENEELKIKLQQYELPGDMRAYYVINRLLNKQADFLDEFDFVTNIKATVQKDDKTYDRASELWEKLPANISRLQALKVEIGATGDEEKDTAKKPTFLDKAIR